MSLIAKLLAPLENRPNQAAYKPLQRKVLFVLSSLFLFLAGGVFMVAFQQGQSAAYFPVVVFGLAGTYGLLAAIKASDQAVANLWNGGR